MKNFKGEQIERQAVWGLAFVECGFGSRTLRYLENLFRLHPKYITNKSSMFVEQTSKALHPRLLFFCLYYSLYVFMCRPVMCRCIMKRNADISCTKTRNKMGKKFDKIVGKCEVNERREQMAWHFEWSNGRMRQLGKWINVGWNI